MAQVVWIRSQLFGTEPFHFHRGLEFGLQVLSVVRCARDDTVFF